ncbi:MAG: hypothetical protein A2Z18_08055 [Armatimonadetes bacterium RBG_16_58_9]|nr:MAG: hypothetical protein A2Z18_08055 [Armatimonadetes bacterium RBG_16_58_9]
MKPGIYVCIASILLVGAISCAATAGIIFDDPLDGSTLGTASGVQWGSGVSGQAAVFTAGNSYIGYDGGYFPAQGTMSFFLKAAGSGERSVLDTVGKGNAEAGDIALLLAPGNTLTFYGRGASDWHVLSGTKVLGSSSWAYVAISYGPTFGMNLYVNGVADGTFSASGNMLAGRNAADIFLGDYPLDGGSYYLAVPGSIDMFRASTTERDINLLTAPAVPEPTSLVALAGGLICSIGAFRRKRS